MDIKEFRKKYFKIRIFGIDTDSKHIYEVSKLYYRFSKKIDDLEKLKLLLKSREFAITSILIRPKSFCKNKKTNNLMEYIRYNLPETPERLYAMNILKHLNI